MCDPAFCLSALRIMCTASHTYSVLLSPASTVCVRPARRPSGHCHARPSARVSSTGLETQGQEASPAQPRVTRRSAPLITGGSQLAGSFFSAERRKTCRRREFLYPPGGGLFWLFLQATAVHRASHPAPTRVPLRVCGTQAPASEMGTGNSASHLRVCRTNLDG